MRATFCRVFLTMVFLSLTLCKLPTEGHHSKAELLALVFKACFRLVKSREVLLNSVSSRLCRSNQEGFVISTLGSSTAFCDFKSVFPTKSKARESVFMSTRQTPEPACLDAQIHNSLLNSNAGLFIA